MDGEGGHDAVRAGEGDRVPHAGNVTGAIDAGDAGRLHLVNVEDGAEHPVFDRAAQALGEVTAEPVGRADIERIERLLAAVRQLNRGQMYAFADQALDACGSIVTPRRSSSAAVSGSMVSPFRKKVVGPHSGISVAWWADIGDRLSTPRRRSLNS